MNRSPYDTSSPVPTAPVGLEDPTPRARAFDYAGLEREARGVRIRTGLFFAALLAITASALVLASCPSRAAASESGPDSRLPTPDSPPSPPSLDFNADGFVTGDDYDAFRSAFERGDPSADYNRDGFVNGDDFDQFTADFKSHADSPPFGSIDANGWTVISPLPPGYRVEYVPASAPPGTYTAAVAKVCAHNADAVAVERGSLIHEPTIITSGSNDPGRPLIIFAYGDTSLPRPRFVVDSATYSAVECSWGSKTDLVVSNVWLCHLDFSPSPRSGAEEGEGVRWLHNGSGILLEGCSIDGFHDGLNLQGGVSGPGLSITLRRCSISNSWSGTAAHSNGVYSEYTAAAFDGCVFDHNGWREGVSGAEATIFNHHVYTRNGTHHWSFTNCAFLSPSSHALNLNGHHNTVRDCLIVDSPVALFVRCTTTTVDGVVIDGSRDIGPGIPRGFGVLCGPAFDEEPQFSGPLSVSHVLVLNKDPSVAHGDQSAVEIGTLKDARGEDVSLVNITVYRWASPNGWINTDPAAPPPGGRPDLFNVAGQQVAVGSTPLPEWPHPERNTAAYAAMVGAGPTAKDLFAAMRSQRLGSWDPKLEAKAVNEWIRAGFTPAPK